MTQSVSNTNSLSCSKGNPVLQIGRKAKSESNPWIWHRWKKQKLSGKKNPKKFKIVQKKGTKLIIRQKNKWKIYKSILQIPKFCIQKNITFVIDISLDYLICNCSDHTSRELQLRQVDQI